MAFRTITSRLMIFVVAVGIADRALGQPIENGDIRVAMDVTASWLSLEDPNLPLELTPTDVVEFPDQSGRLMVSTLGGQIRIIDESGLLPEPFLTPSQSRTLVPQESGMTSVAFHPNFADEQAFGHGKFYTITTEAPETAVPDFGTLPEIRIEHQAIVREWDMSVGNNSLSSNVYVGDLSRELLRIDQPGPFHNVYDLAFDEIGQLYISVGDGGDSPGFDRFAESQNLQSVYGTVLRINPETDAEGTISANGQYVIPDDNPFTNDDAAIGEIWAYGVRSPYRMNFDRETGDLWLGDVGERTSEEVSIIRPGGNHGWPLCEGDFDFRGDCESPDLIDPVFTFTREDLATRRVSVIGGFVYRGSQIPELFGKYVFADLGQSDDAATLLYGDIADGTIKRFLLDPQSALFPIEPAGTSFLPDRILSIGEDLDGELYIVAGQDPRAAAPSQPGAFIMKLVPGPSLTGDTNFDGIVDFDDFVRLSAHYQQPGGWPEGDFDLNGFVDFQDFVSLAANFSSSPAANVQSVPEPVLAAHCLAIMVFLGTCRRRRFRRRRSIATRRTDP